MIPKVCVHIKNTLSFLHLFIIHLLYVYWLYCFICGNNHILVLFEIIREECLNFVKVEIEKVCACGYRVSLDYSVAFF